MTERVFRYFVTALLIFPFIVLVDVFARPVSLGNYDLREILYLLFSIPIGLLVYCAWVQPQVIREMFGPFRPESPVNGEVRPAVYSRINRRNMVFVGLGLGVLLICGCQFALGLTVASKFGLLPVPKTPIDEFEATRMAAVATNLAASPAPNETLAPVETNPGTETVLTETPSSLKGTPTSETVLTATPQTSTLPAKYAVGEQGQVNGIGVTVLGIQSTDSLDTLTPAPDNTFLVLEVVIQNISHKGELPYAPTDFLVQDANGVQYQATSTSLEPSLGSGSLALAGVAQGYISFEVPLTVTGLVAIYGPVDLLGGNPPIQVDLGQ
jgi:hypothetical protein